MRSCLEYKRMMQSFCALDAFEPCLLMDKRHRQTDKQISRRINRQIDRYIDENIDKYIETKRVREKNKKIK